GISRSSRRTWSPAGPRSMSWRRPARTRRSRKSPPTWRTSTSPRCAPPKRKRPDPDAPAHLRVRDPLPAETAALLGGRGFLLPPFLRRRDHGRRPDRRGDRQRQPERPVRPDADPAGDDRDWDLPDHGVRGGKRSPGRRDPGGCHLLLVPDPQGRLPFRPALRFPGDLLGGLRRGPARGGDRRADALAGARARRAVPSGSLRLLDAG